MPKQQLIFDMTDDEIISLLSDKNIPKDLHPIKYSTWEQQKKDYKMSILIDKSMNNHEKLKACGIEIPKPLNNENMLGL